MACFSTKPKNMICHSALISWPAYEILVLITLVNGLDSYKPAHLPSLIRAFAAGTLSLKKNYVDKWSAQNLGLQLH